MYRILVLFAILNIADCHWCNGKPHCQLKNNHYHGRKYDRGFGHKSPATGTPEFVPGNTFEEIASNVIKIENALKKFCDENNINRASEIYGEDNYILKYRLPEFDETNIDIKIMNRVIYTTADRKDGTIKSFKDLRILPDIVRANEAKWVYEHKTVKIFVPYKVPLRNEAVKDCGAVDDSVKNVPQMGSPGLGFRSGPGIPVGGF